MSTNGDRPSARPGIEIPSVAEPAEAAAVIAAVEQFLSDTAPPAGSAAGVRPWQRAALLEGVRSKEGFASPWGEPRTWGRRHSSAPGEPG